MERIGGEHGRPSQRWADGHYIRRTDGKCPFGSGPIKMTLEAKP